MKRKQVLALLLAVAMTANMTMPAYAATAPVSGSIFWDSQETAAITEEDLAAAMAAAVSRMSRAMSPLRRTAIF